MREEREEGKGSIEEKTVENYNEVSGVMKGEARKKYIMTK